MATEPRYAAVLAHLEDDDEAKAEHVEEDSHAHHIVAPPDGPLTDPADEAVLEGAAHLLTPDSLDMRDGAHFFADERGDAR